MYHQYFGLSEAPFSIAVNPRYLFMSARHRDALAHLLYGVGAGGGFILLTGEVGTGKTTINRCLLEQLPPDTDIAIILNPALNSLELLATACDELHIDYDVDNHTLKTLTDKLHAYLLDNHSRGRSTVLMIDEAQHLDFEVLEQIRLLTNLETNTRKLLQIILIGQPELIELLNRPELRQLNQRITARYNLEPLNMTETAAYIHHRLQVAGLPPGRELFPAAVIRGIYRRTRGVPRLINVLCDRILLGAYGRNKMCADTAMLKVAAREVMGEETAPRARGMLLAVAAVFLLAVGLWFGRQWLWVASAEKTVLQPSVAATPRPAQTPLPETAVAIAAVVEPIAVIETSPRNEDQTVSTWLLPSQAALERLWYLLSQAPAPANLCTGSLSAGLACVEEHAETWDELRSFERPVALEMVTPQRFGASVLLLGIVGSNCYLYSDAGVELIALAELGSLWSGRYYFLWHPPKGFESPVALGDISPVVAEIAALFAQLDGREASLAENLFNEALKTRVTLFQRQHQLEDDGVVGIRTLLKLNEQLGIDLTANRARDQLEQSPPEVVLR
jgi:general secretion pathway protein A